MDKSCTVNSPGTLTWLQAAEHVLREEGPEMHIRDLTNRILEQGMVKSNCATSLETLLYRHTSGSGNVAVGRGRAGSSYGTGASAGGASGGGAGVQNLQSSKFVRVPGKHGWFGLRDPHSLPSVGVPSVVEAEDRLLMDTTSNSDVISEDRNIQNGVEQELSFEPKAFYSANALSQQYSRKRRHSYHSSGGESVSSLSGGSEDELAGDMGEMGDGDGSSEFTSDEDSGADEALYRKKYLFVKRVAKNMIHVCRDRYRYTHSFVPSPIPVLYTLKLMGNIEILGEGLGMRLSSWAVHTHMHTYAQRIGRSTCTVLACLHRYRGT